MVAYPIDIFKSQLVVFDTRLMDKILLQLGCWKLSLDYGARTSFSGIVGVAGCLP